MLRQGFQRERERVLGGKESKGGDKEPKRPA